MNKEGISHLVVVLLMIVLAIAAILIIWSRVRIFIEEENELAEIKSRFFTENMDITNVQPDSTNPSLLTATIKKTTGKIQLVSEELVESSILEIDLMSIVDLSGSMKCSSFSLGWDCFDDRPTCENLPPSGCGGQWLAPLNSLKNANNNLISTLITPQNNNRMSIVSYSGDIFNSTDITNNAAQLSSLVNSWDEKILGSGTCICCGIINATNKLLAQSPNDKPKIMVVMTDGEATLKCPLELGVIGDLNSNGAPNDEGDHAIKAACNANLLLNKLTIYSIGLGDSIDEETLKEIAKCGNGQYFSASVDDIIDKYNQIIQEIKKNYETIQIINYLKIVFYNETSSYVGEIKNLPEILETRNYEFNLEGKINNIKKVEIYPVIIAKSGKEIIGPVLDSFNVK